MDTSFLNGKKIVITGATGTVGKALTKIILRSATPTKLVLVNQSENNQVNFMRELAEEFTPEVLAPTQFCLLDIANYALFAPLVVGADYVIHTAALKHINLCEDNPQTAINTNVIGTQNVVNACIFGKVKKAVLLSTDKAVNPSSTYGASKLLAESLFLSQSNQVTNFSVLRCGNIAGSHGSVVPFFAEKLKKGEHVLPITDEKMVRFWLNVNQVVNALLFLLSSSVGGEVLIPKMPSFYLTDLVKALSSTATYKVVGLRKGEKINEEILNHNKAIFKSDDYYLELPADKPAPQGYIKVTNINYSTQNNPIYLSIEELKQKIKELNLC